MKTLLRLVAVLVALVVVAALASVLWLRGSLPPAGESREADGLAAEVAVEYDAAGVPTIRAAHDADLCFAQGWAHARDRRFQMELLVRSAGGRLSEVVGRAALPSDRTMRTFGFEAVAESGLAAMPPDRRALYEAYARGVRAYDATHPSPPEFGALGLARGAWRAEDCLLVLLAMYHDLQDTGDSERGVECMDAALPKALVDFLTPTATTLDVVLAPGADPAPAPIPGPEVVNLRGAGAAAPAATIVPRGRRPAALAWMRGEGVDGEAPDLGSNNWVLAPSRTSTGSAIVANDPHLGLRVPNIWHRQRHAAAGLELTGVTLPGYPGVVIGANGFIAWGLTNAECDAADLVRLAVADADTSAWAGPSGPEPFRVRTEVIGVKGAPAETLRVRDTRFGPVVGASLRGGLLALQWVALDPRSMDIDPLEFSRSRSVAEFLARQHGFRGPNQNFVVADRDGHIAWRESGWVPRRAGFDPRRPRDGADGGARWVGLVDADSMPAVVDPPQGFLVTANQRVAGGAARALLGDGQAMPFRARRIADALAARSDWDAAKTAALQNDIVDSVLFGLTRAALARALTDEACASDSVLARVRAVLARDGGRADTGSVAHAYLRFARVALNDFATDALVAPCRARDSSFVYDWTLKDEVTRRLLDSRPLHLLPPAYDDWDALVRAAARDAARRLEERAGGRPFDTVTWGSINRARIHHPLGDAVPALGRWLDMPAAQLAGGSAVVRVASPRSGASMRFVADLGDPARSLFSMPGGQSGHFLSNHYGDGFADWVAGRTTAFVPGAAVSTVRLQPRRAR